MQWRLVAVELERSWAFFSINERSEPDYHLSCCASEASVAQGLESERIGHCRGPGCSAPGKFLAF